MQSLGLFQQQGVISVATLKGMGDMTEEAMGK